MKFQLLNLICTTICLMLANPTTVKAISITNNNDATNLVNTLLGTNSGITIVGTPQYRGASAAAGTFTGGNSNANLGLDAGVILSTGKVSDAVGLFNPANVVNTRFNTPGDAALTQISTTNTFTIGTPRTADAAILSFDFTSDTNNVYLTSIFGSQQYPIAVGSAFNDAMAFFVDGQNIAFLPGTTTPITINTVNDGLLLTGINKSNPQFYRSNSDNNVGLQFGGFTVPITAQLLGLTPGVHNFRIAIADTGDAGVDSAVFLQAGSLSAGIQSAPATSVPEPLTIFGTAIGGWSALRLRKRLLATNGDSN